MEPKDSQPEDFQREIAEIGRLLALQNALDLSRLARANMRKVNAGPEGVAAWATLKSGLRAFISHARQQDYPVRFLRNQLPTKAIGSSQDIEFMTLARDVLRTLGTNDHWTAYWFQRRLVTYKVFVDIPFASRDESLLAVRSELLNLSKVRQGSIQGASRLRRIETQAIEKERNMGATFDLFGPESLKRTIFQYWVYNTDTDEIAVEGTFIAKGDTLQEATRQLFEGLRGKLSAVASPSLKVHVKKIDEFTKQPPSGKSLAEQFVDAVRDEIKREVGKS